MLKSLNCIGILLIVGGMAGCATSQSRHETALWRESTPAMTATSPPESSKPPSPRRPLATPAVVKVSHQTRDKKKNHHYTLSEFQQLALRHNPAIQQTAAAAERAEGVRDQVALAPNPRVGYFANEVGDDRSAGLHGAFISQTFVRGDKLEWNRHVLDHDVESMSWQVQGQRTRVLTDVRIRFMRALAAQRRIKLAGKFRIVAQRGLKVAKDRLKEAGTRPDVLQSEIQLSEVDLLIQKSKLEFTAAWRELAAIAGVPNLPPHKLEGKLKVTLGSTDLNAEHQRLVSKSPLLKAAEEMALRAQANLERQRAQNQPNWTGQFGFGHDTATGDEFVNVQLSVPLQIHNVNQGNIRAAYSALAEASQNVRRLKLKLRQDLAAVMKDFQVALATVKLYETTILKKAEQSQRLIDEAHMAGEVDFLRVLSARRMLFDTELRYIDALRDLATAHTLIEGLLLTGSLSNAPTYGGHDSLRGQALNGQQ